MGDKPDSEVNIKLARCGKCKSVVFASVEHMMTKDSMKELLDCVKVGCTVEIMPLLEYRKTKFEWCNTKCDKK